MKMAEMFSTWVTCCGTPSCYVTGVTAASVIVTWSEFRQSAPVLRVTT